MGARTLRYLAQARPIEVETDDDGNPTAVILDGRRHLVEVIREEWLIQDQWWTKEPVTRRYFDLIMTSGRRMEIYRSGEHWGGVIAARTNHAAQAPHRPLTTRALRGVSG